MHKVIIPAMILISIITTTGCQPTRSQNSKIELWPLLESHSTTTLREDGWEKVRTGLTTPQEVLRVTKV